MTDPFAAPAAIPSSFPTVASFRGRLVLIKPLKQETVPNNLGAPGSTQERVTADITVVDGIGPVPQMKGNPPTPTGQMFEGPEYRGVYIQSEVLVKQLAEALAGRTQVLAWIDTRNPGTNPMKGNPWGLIDATTSPDAVQTARNFLASRTIGAATAPAPQPAYAAAQNTVQYVQQAPAQAQILAQGAPAPQPAYTPPPANFPTGHSVPAQAPPAAPSLPQPGSAPAGVNPFA